MLGRAADRAARRPAAEGSGGAGQGGPGPREEVGRSTRRSRSRPDVVPRAASARGSSRRPRAGRRVIVMGGEPPSRIRGGALLGGIGGSRRRRWATVTEYVLRKAPCRCCSRLRQRDRGGLSSRAPSPRWIASRLCSSDDRRCRARWVVPREGDAARRAHRLVPRRGLRRRMPRLEIGLEKAVGGRGRPVHGSARALEIEALQAAGIELRRRVRRRKRTATPAFWAFGITSFRPTPRPSRLARFHASHLRLFRL